MKPACRVALSLWIVICFAAVPAWAQLEEPLETAGAIEAVTVYRGQALVTRRVEVAANAGVYEVIVRDLPAEVVPGSIYAESTAGVQIRSVRYRIRPEQEDVREDVRNLDRQIQAVQRNIKTHEQQRALAQQHTSLLNKLESFTAPSAEWELARGVLNAETIESLTQFLMAQRQALSERELEISFKLEDLALALQQLQREHATLTRSSTRASREAVVFVEVEQPNSSFRLRYLVNEATWAPSYNVRAAAARDRVTVEYLASVRQLSGEDWNGVTMTLSTATPTLASEAPRLSALTVSLTDALRGDQAALFGEARDADGYLQVESELREQQRNLERQRGQNAMVLGLNEASGAPATRFNYENDRALNTLSGNRQLLDVIAGRGRASGIASDPRRGMDESISVIYQLEGRTSLPGRSDHQLIRIADRAMDATFYRLAIPVLTEHVYEEAQLVNTLDTVLLAGPVSSYLAGEFVGHGELPTVAAGETFTLGFGIDSSLRARRELIDRQESTQGGNRLVTMQYRLTLSNFGPEPRDVRVLDRLPVAAEGSDVRVELLETSHPLHAAGAQVGRQTLRNVGPRRDEGELRWDVQAPAEAVGDDALHIEYRYTLEYDRQKQLEGAAR